jgi:hypothetical protein
VYLDQKVVSLTLRCEHNEYYCNKEAGLLLRKFEDIITGDNIKNVTYLASMVNETVS